MTPSAADTRGAIDADRSGVAHEPRPGGTSAAPRPFRLGVFTRLVDQVPAGEVYARGLDLLTTAEALGFDVGWVAQHHAHHEGGLPAPLVFLATAAARTSRLRLATGIITLPLEQPLRLAEDAAVLDVLSNGRLELGFGTGGNRVVFSMFGRDLDQRQDDYERAFSVLKDALSGASIAEDGGTLWPPAERLSSSIWEAAMSVPSAIRAGQHGSRLLLARTAPRASLPDADGGGVTRQTLGDAQAPLVEAYLKHWPASLPTTPRIGLSRSIYVAESRAEALADAEAGMRRFARLAVNRPGIHPNLSLEALLAAADVHIGSPSDVIAGLRADPLLAVATDLILQVHPVDPAHDKTLRSLRLIAGEVAPALGWQPHADQVHPAAATPA